MLSTSLLYAKTVSPMGRIVKEETFAGASLAFLGIVIVAVLSVAFVLYVS